MDSTDQAIIDVLQQDGRISNVDLAERVNLTPGPCMRRVQRLEAAGVIQGYGARVTPAAIGRGFEVILDVDLIQFDRDSVHGFEEALAAYDEVVEMHRLFGSPDYFVRIAVANLEAYEDFLSNQVLVIPGIQKVSSRFTMKTIKR
ncbi:Lrp/AsnC family transcriptional regulator [Arthrobacter sp. ISL-28]|uniref:Lrp/AsnC family transcriptional regulator n=1 Tax=Arthrobacter sp. ISL-28 TaxID=2819108 RepID=UPI001BE9F5EF|nr:Lrp/AsnC family transcriptional regulator [Arthrobacter sp. ISL-28]MBT2522586.1 Lrp/AsnC family transcriptional regulator [Arthrobacter sp. ISL-28]